MTFINALASECLGRTYLLQKQDLVQVLVSLLNQEEGDTNLRQNALGTLQKFSLRRRPQSIMIQLDMIMWISNVLKMETESLSDYSIEYATALLMNLSLRAAGKDKCEDPEIELLKVLNDLVEHENLQVRTYVNGTLYSIFTRKKLREEAKELGMFEVLQYLMTQSDDQFKRQIQYILDQLNTQGEGNQNEELEGTQSGAGNPDEDEEEDFDEEEDEEDDEEEEDIVEEEDGEFNDIIDEQGIMVGEDWLVSEFIASQDEAVGQNKTIAMLLEQERQRIAQQQQMMAQQDSVTEHSYSAHQVQQNQDGRPLMRPTTPLKSSQTTRTHQTPNQQNQSYMMTYDQKINSFAEAVQKDEAIRNVPSELRSRPKIPRSPGDHDLREDFSPEDGDQHDPSSKLSQMKPDLDGDGPTKEWEEGFITRERVPRTPPEEVKRRKLAKKKGINPNQLR